MEFGDDPIKGEFNEFNSMNSIKRLLIGWIRTPSDVVTRRIVKRISKNPKNPAKSLRILKNPQESRKFLNNLTKFRKKIPKNP